MRCLRKEQNSFPQEFWSLWENLSILPENTRKKTKQKNHPRFHQIPMKEELLGCKWKCTSWTLFTVESGCNETGRLSNLVQHSYVLVGWELQVRGLEEMFKETWPQKWKLCAVASVLVSKLIGIRKYDQQGVKYKGLGSWDNRKRIKCAKWKSRKLEFPQLRKRIG